MQANNKSVIITLAAILVAAFFMPWIKFFVSLSAWDMLFGDAGRYIDTAFKYIALLIPIAGGIIIYGAAFNKENYPVDKKLLFVIPIITIALLIIAIYFKLGDNGGRIRNSDLKEIFQIFGIGIWLTLISSIILPFLQKKEENYNAFSAPKANVPAIPTENQINENQILTPTPTQPLSNLTRPQININLPKINWEEFFAKIKTFTNKYKIVLLSIFGMLILFLIVYNLFLKANPVKDAKDLAKNYCNCSDELAMNNLSSLQTYLNEFETKKYKSKVEARNSLNNIMQENQSKYTTCTQSASLKYTERQAEYNANGGQNAYTFEQTYSSIINVCSNNNSSDVVVLQSQVDEKIKSIIDPEPDIEKIKADIIGQEIIGWRFAYLNEFKSAEILNTVKANDRIEYQVKFGLIDNTTNSGEHDCEVMVVYLQNDYGWYFSDLSLNYITYTNTIYPDKYIEITPFQNCKWTAENKYNISWKTSNWEYASDYITGPNNPPVNLPGSNSYFLKSLEQNEIKVKFTYSPYN